MELFPEVWDPQDPRKWPPVFPDPAAPATGHTILHTNLQTVKQSGLWHIAANRSTAPELLTN